MSKLPLYLAAGLVIACSRPDGAPPDPKVRTITVVPFLASSTTHRALSEAVAESLAARLSRLPGLVAKVDPHGWADHSELWIQGDIASQDSRLMIRAGVFGPSRRDTLWTGTFWRKDSLNTALIEDLSASLAEAIYGHLARSNGKPNQP